MPFMKTGNIDLYYEIQGEGLPLLFISGLGGGAWMWSGQTPFFKNHYRCIAFHNVGAGLSAKPPGPYTIAGMAEDALRLLDGLGVEKAFVFSISMGGMIALELARIASPGSGPCCSGAPMQAARPIFRLRPKPFRCLWKTQGQAVRNSCGSRRPFFTAKGFKQKIQRR